MATVTTKKRRKISYKIKRNNPKVTKEFSSLPQKVIDFPEGDYDCRISAINRVENGYGEQIVVELEGLPMDGTFVKYFNIDYGILPGSKLYQFLKSMGVITNGNDILWDDLINRNVTASLALKKGKPYVEALVYACNPGEEEEIIEDDEDYEDEDDYYEDEVE